MKGWLAATTIANRNEPAEDRSFRETEDGELYLKSPSSPMPPVHEVLIVDRFSFSMIDCDRFSVTSIEVREISKLDATQLVYEHQAKVAHAIPEWTASMLEKELQMPDVPKTKLTPTTTLLVVERMRWNDVRFFLVCLSERALGVCD